MNIVNIINKKREFEILNEEEISYFINAYVNNEIKDYQASALLMAICLNGMNDEEVFYLTKGMLNSGDIFDYTKVDGVKIDKHSTGGVGDKTTLVVAPLVASCGLVVPKMSGRGLGHTGGTIDKLEAIEGFNVNLSNEDFIKQLNEIGLAITTSSLNFVPADKKLYALRDVTGTVASIPLIASSIMSKKLAGNADKIVLDVKVGDGAFLKNKEEAKELANIMIKIGHNFNKEVIALITNMDYPLGNSIGNGLEVREAIETLKGNNNNNFKDLCLEIAIQMVSIGKNISIEKSREEVITNLNNGKAYNKFKEMVAYQGGDIDNIIISNKTTQYKALRSGYLNQIKTLDLGKYVMELGAGRQTKEDIIDYGVGIVLHVNCGDYINEGDIIATIYYNKGYKSLDDIFVVEDDLKEPLPLIYEIIK